MSEENFDLPDFITLPMELAMFGFSINKLLGKLLLVRFDRTKILAETAQAIIDNQPEEIEKQYGKMYSNKTIENEWAELEAIKNEISDAMTEKMPLFLSANTSLENAGKEGIDLSELQLPNDKLEEIKFSATPDNVYDKLQEYNEILNDFSYKIVNLCNDLGMMLTHI